MQTANGKLIVTDRQELDAAKEQIVTLDRRSQKIENQLIAWEQQKSEVMQTVNYIKSLNTQHALLERKIQQITTDFNRQKTYNQLLSIATVVSLCVGGLWIGNSLSDRSNSLPASVQKSTFDRPNKSLKTK
ncbi:hypothetical protein [Chamaesiphon polymorphus]|uniref:Uncharacterized protein n=1 Tax=Chamaesiphon polymorphus CCALA 037 TaxID=2107692 RepID=A0A2T1GLL4_9CYAN|nr:hypothetical protein [Chamaesiphon polymorphus]PSB58768.1 hypothetical protein C7B77_03490 [Chamaesiphon polymorphus CCALA 037]